jgi:guanylate kinase
MLKQKEKNNKILIISGPTGSGESTISNEIVSRHGIFKRLITATSRPPRSGEVDGESYFFFSKEEFKKKIEKRDIVEFTYIENRDTYYGSYEPDLEKKLAHGHVIVNVDHVGVRYYKEKYCAVAIFIKPESIESIAQRLKKRNPEMTAAELESRLENAKNEIENEEKYYDYVVFNRDGKLKEAVGEIEGILAKEQFIL